MRARLVTIDDGKYVVIPEEMLRRTGIAGEVSMEVEGNALVLRPAEHPRMEWSSAFRTMHEDGDDALLDAEDVYRYLDGMEGRW